MFGDIIVQKYFQGQFLLKLWEPWELIMTETPLLLVADNPSECSHAVILLLSLISPLKSSADYRPYVTIYENDIKEFMQLSKEKKIGNVILGVSNPYFTKIFSGYPAVLRMDSSYYDELQVLSPKNEGLDAKSLKKAKGLKYALKLNKVKPIMKPNLDTLKHL